MPRRTPLLFHLHSDFRVTASSCTVVVVAKETVVGVTAVLELVLNNFLLTTIRGLVVVVGLTVVDVTVVGVVPDRIAGRVRFLKNGTVDKVLGVVFGGKDCEGAKEVVGADVVLLLVYL